MKFYSENRTNSYVFAFKKLTEIDLTDFSGPIAAELCAKIQVSENAKSWRIVLDFYCTKTITVLSYPFCIKDFSKHFIMVRYRQKN